MYSTFVTLIFPDCSTGHDYGRPTSRGPYMDDPRAAPGHRVPLDAPHRDRAAPERDAWYRGGLAGENEPVRGDDRGGHHHYDRHSTRDWEHNDLPGIRPSSAGRVDVNYPLDEGRRGDGPVGGDWSAGGERQWDERGLDRGHGSDRGPLPDHGHNVDRPNWHHAEREVENWDAPEDYGPGDYHRGHGPEKIHHEVEPLIHGMSTANRSGPGNRRWPNWRGGRNGGRGGGGGRGGAGGGDGGNNNAHNAPEGGNLFRRQNQMHNQQDNFQDHQAEHPFRRHQGSGVHPHQTGDYQAPHHHGHNAFSSEYIMEIHVYSYLQYRFLNFTASIVRPLLSLPPLKPPIMDDIVPSVIIPTVPLKKTNPFAIAVPIEEVAPAVVPAVIAVVVPPINTVEEKAPPEMVVEAAPLPKEVPKEGAAADKESDEVEEDALSEISDDADDILNRQEVRHIFVFGVEAALSFSRRPIVL